MLEEAQETTQVTNTAWSDKDIRQNTDYIYTHTHTQGLINKQDMGEHRKKGRKLHRGRNWKATHDTWGKTSE